ncbi:hypothetical protein SASPL_145050 [Salvia splendens]|uniref:Uncharacterized protein n=1 Tax=Salvia splendens TaxID=180675 RepID=A0A8X8WGU8_SALSN|nr:hypothetical protein SASPL_145050 [Salvia splendens]
MLQIRLSKPASEAGAAANPAPVDTVTVACPDHLVLADLPVAKGMGAASATAVIKSVPVASSVSVSISAFEMRLSRCYLLASAPGSPPCISLAPATSGRYQCASHPGRRAADELLITLSCEHVIMVYLNLDFYVWHILIFVLNPFEAMKKSSTRSVNAISYICNSQLHDSEYNAQLPQSREQPPPRPAVQQRPAPPFPRQTPDHPSEHPDRGTSQNHFPQHTFEAHVQGSGWQDSINPNSGPAPPQYDYPPYAADGTQQSTDGFMNVDPQGRGLFQNAGNKSMEQQRQGGNFVDPRDNRTLVTGIMMGIQASAGQLRGEIASEVGTRLDILHPADTSSYWV